MAQFREVEEFTKLGFSLDAATKRMVARGVKLTRLLVQNRFEPIDIVEQTIFLYAALNGFSEGIPNDKLYIFEKELYSFFRKSVFYEPFKFQLRESLELDLLLYFLRLFKHHFFIFFKDLI